MSKKERIFWGCLCGIVFGPLIVLLFFAEPGPPLKVNIGCCPCQTVTIAVPHSAAVIRVDDKHEWTAPAGDTRFTVRVMK